MFCVMAMHRTVKTEVFFLVIGETTSVIEDIIPKCNEQISLATYEQSSKYKSLEFSSVEILPSLGLHNLFSKLFE